jgi:hypothetical protein
MQLKLVARVTHVPPRLLDVAQAEAGAEVIEQTLAKNLI